MEPPGKGGSSMSGISLMRQSPYLFREGEEMPADKELKEELAKKAGGRKKGDSPQTPMPKTAVMEADIGSPTIRLLRADEIECRVPTINEKGLSLLLFKDARVDQRILDETFTPFGWRRTHQCIDGKLYCTVEVWDSAKGQWVAKQDVGTESYSEKEKGQASDSFKRACFNWGLGRELYTAPFIWIPAEVANIQKKEKDREQKYYTSDRFRVQAISYDEERAIDFLVVVNAKGQAVYSMDKRKDAMLAKKKAAAAGNMPGNGLGYLSQEQQDTLKRELERTGVTLDTVLARYHLQSPEQIDGETYRKAMKSLKNSKSREAA